MSARRLTAFLLGIAIVFSLAVLDRPLASFVHRTFASPALFHWADGVFTLLSILGALLVAACLGLSWLALRRRPLRPWMRTLLVSSAAGVSALIVSEVLKFVIGRSPAYPDFAVNGISRFVPFHWGPGIGSFPSSTLSTTTAVVVVLWNSWSRARALYGIALLSVWAMILVVNAHWLSDTLAGMLLGVSVATAAADPGLTGPVGAR